METGTVKWFSNSKGYGFISPNEREADVFAHFSAISMDGYRTLKRGQKVSFDITDGPKGLLALNIRLWPDGVERAPLSADSSPIQSNYSAILPS